MGRFIHARRIDGEIMFRDWCTVTDTYITEPMTRERCIEYLLHDDGIGFTRAEMRSGGALSSINGRLERAIAHGTSAIPNAYWSESKDPMSDPWDTDRCGECGSFHHAFDRRESDGECANCGCPEDDVGHKRPCMETA